MSRQIKSRVDDTLTESKGYLEIQTTDDEHLSKEEALYIPDFIRLERRGDWIALRSPSAAAFRHHLLSGTEITGKVDGSYPYCLVTISSQADTLAKFLTKHGDEVLHRRQVYRRINKP
jgi:hypothetical protein